MKTAAEQLTSTRSMFVEKVSKAVIRQLLDNLLEDGVLNDGEKESILEESPVRADQARTLIDTVTKKGEESSKKMITHLQNRDPTLFTELGLSCVNPPPPTKEKEKEDDEEEEETEHNDDIYPVTSATIRSRVALLITNMRFTNVKLNRSGADKDEENMEKLLTSLEYEVVKHTNLTGKQIDDAVLQFSKHPKLKETDSVWVVIMSHGKLGQILGVNWKKGDATPDEFSIDNIYKYLDSEHCPALLNKPKVVVIQACRGGERGSVLINDSAEAADEASGSCPAPGAFEDDTVRFVHKEKDFISLLSCTPDTVSYREKGRGSLLIQYIVEIFEKLARSHDIEELFRRVMRRFEDFSPGNRRQMATKDRCTLTKRFFIPGP